MGGGCKLSGDSAVVCLGLRALFVRAAVGPWRAELWAHGAELCWLRNLISSLGHGMVFCPLNLCILSCKKGLEAPYPFHQELGDKGRSVVAVISRCLIWYHPQLLPSPSCAPAHGAFWEPEWRLTHGPTTQGKSCTALSRCEMVACKIISLFPLSFKKIISFLLSIT